MGNWVQCNECSNRYDLDVTTFCSRCGSVARTASVAPAALGARPRTDEAGRRRAQLGGVLCVIIGLVFLTGSLAFMVTGEAKMRDTLETFFTAYGNATLAGGTVDLTVVSNGTPVAANVTFTTPGGLVFLNATTDRAGHLLAPMPEHGVANMTITVGNISFVRPIYTMRNDVLTVRLDVATAPRQASERLGIQTALDLSRVLLYAIVAISVLLVASGVAAVLVRWHLFAMIGMAPVLILTTYLTVGTLSIGPAIVLGLEFAALLLIASGRRAFAARRRQ